MKTRPHIVTQTCVIKTGGFERSANALAARMEEAGHAGGMRWMIRYSAVLIRLMKIILDLTERNTCFTRRREVLASPKLRSRIMESLGGAHALEKWRRQDTWNRARLRAIADGTYIQQSVPDIAPARKPKLRPFASPATPPLTSPKPRRIKRAGPPEFRLPVLQNLRAVPAWRRALSKPAPRQARRLCTVLWPHELDGQYVPGFKSRARHPGGAYSDYAAPADTASAGRAVPGAPP